MAIYRINPISDLRWAEFLARHPQASIFHAPGWLEALRQSYGYEPVVFTTTPPHAELRNGLIFCQINSRLTGRRLVSLPFADHCEPLVERSDDLRSLLEPLTSELQQEKWRYIELRPLQRDLQAAAAEFRPVQDFCVHRLDLRKSAEQLFRSFNKDSVQRKIRRAARESIISESGTSETLLRKFYHLLVRTRRRQRLPPQPLQWFRNLAMCLGDKLKVRVASSGGMPIAAILTLSFKDSLVYKNGCSDERFHSLGGMHLLLWEAIQEANSDGASKFDLGRSGLDTPGLIVFKERWGAMPARLTYWRYPAYSCRSNSANWQVRMARPFFGYMPESLLVASGRLLYRHLG